VRPNQDANARLYGEETSGREILVDSKLAVPASAQPFVDSIRMHMEKGARYQFQDVNRESEAMEAMRRYLPASRSTATFIHSFVTSPIDQLVVEAIVGVARGMSKKTIAEFVPDDATGRLLVKMGVD
jgi:EAL domain-containing protein (putative c-di-GMP-specific phosphodiesterase class I)